MDVLMFLYHTLRRVLIFWHEIFLCIFFVFFFSLIFSLSFFLPFCLFLFSLLKVFFFPLQHVWWFSSLQLQHSCSIIIIFFPFLYQIQHILNEVYCACSVTEYTYPKIKSSVWYGVPFGQATESRRVWSLDAFNLRICLIV